ncbi:MAG: TonB-dependent receptor [Candidatus Acidiferrales bacterium]
MQSQKTFVSYGRVCALLLAVALIPALARAQQSITGELKGAVTDASGAVIPGAAVSIQNVATGLVTPSTTNASGLYDVPFLSPGNYIITFTKQGFRDFIRQGIKLEIETLEIDATLQIGTATQEVVVNSAAPLVETETSEQHQNVNEEQVEATPIVGTFGGAPDWRNALVAMAPGVNNGGGSGSANGQQAGVNGTQGYNIGFTIDGSNATSPRDFNGSNNIVPVDTIAEVNINSFNSGPEYGNGLSAFNAVTKSGTNTWHGSGFLYDQNTVFEARSYTDVTGPKPPTHYNLFGGTVGGPIIKNKLFFFFAYQRLPSTSTVQGTYSYPTTAMEAGNFTGDPLTTVPAGCAGCTTTSIPTADFDTVAKNLQTYFPAATATGWKAGCPTSPTCNPSSDFLFNGSESNTSTFYEGKVDYNFLPNQKLTFSFNYFPNFVTDIAPDPLYPSLASAFESANNYNLTGQVTETWTISPTALNEFRAGAERELDAYLPFSWNKNAPATVGLEPAYGTNAPYNQFPQIVIENGSSGSFNLGTEGSSSVGGGGVNGNGNTNAILGEGTYTFSDILTLIRGRHTIKVGGEFDKFYQNYNNWGASESGSFGFNGNVTGNPYADFLLGDVDQWFVTSDPQESEHNWTSGLFVGDDFKVTSHLTLNLGLRWQIQSGWGVSFNEFGTYDPTLNNTGAYQCNQTADTCALNPNAKGAILLGGASDTANGGTINDLNKLQNNDYKEFAPRVGFAWSPKENWAIRGSFGIFVAPRSAESYTDGATDPFFSGDFLQNNSGGPAEFKLAVGPAPGTFAITTLSSLTPEVSNYNSVEYYQPTSPTRYVSEYMLDIQHEFAGGILVDAGYVYTHGTNQGFQTDTDQAPLGQLSTKCATINEPVNGVMTNVNQNCVGPVPQYSSIVSETYDGWSNYNALQLRLQKRMTYGLSFFTNYAWSKSLDTGTGSGHGAGLDAYQNAYNPAANYGLSDFNAANTLTGEIVWQIPLGSGRQFVLHGVLDEIVGGWQVSGTFQWHSGTPFTPVIGTSGVADALDPGLVNSLSAGVPNNGASSALFANVVGNPVIGSHSNVGIGTQWFNPAAFADPAPGTFGNSGRDTLIGPGFSDVDFSIAKDFPLHWREGMMLQLRADITNLFNHPNFSNPDDNVSYVPGTTTLSDGSSGQITGVTGNARLIQIGAHFTF